MLAMVASPALAQDTDGGDKPAATDKVNGGDQIDQIIVTAQFRSQDLQSTPLAITAVSGADLAAKGINTTQGLTEVAPSVNLRHTGSGGGKTLAAFIRGVGASDYNFGIEPGVAFYIDDVYLGPSYGTMLDFVDLERVEVLRGPQGTLSGKNAIGGAIRLVTVKPRGQNEGYMEVSTGSRGLLRMRGAYDVSIVPDKLFMRVSGYSDYQSGLVKLYDFGCVNPDELGDQSAPHALRANTTPPQSCQNGELGNSDVKAGRVQFRWTPTSDIEINLAGDYIRDTSKGAADVLLKLDPSGFANYVAPGDTEPFFVKQYGVPYDSRFLPPGRYSSYATFEDPVYGLKYPPLNTLTTKDVTLNIDWKVAPNISLQSITAYRAIGGSWAYDSDSSPLQTDGVYDTQKHKQFSQELRLSGTSFNDRFNWTVGGFYYHAKERDIGTIEAAIFNLFITVDSHPKNTNYAGFFHGEYKLTDKLTAIGGVRYSHENKNYHFIEGDIADTPSNVFPGGLDVPAHTSYSRWDWRVGVQYQVNPANMLYADVATGYRGGGFNPRPSNLQTVIGFKPESLVSYEIGQRSEFADRRITWNNTVYYSDYTDIQLSGRTTSIVSGGEFPVTVVTNAAKARIWGWESELDAHVTRDFTLTGAASYTNFKYLDLGVAAPLAATSGPTLDSMQRYTPAWKFNIGGTWVLPVLQDAGKLTFNANYSWQSHQFTDAHNLPDLEIPAYGVANARLNFKTLESGWSLSASVTNLFDKYYFYNLNFVSGNYQLKGNPAPPREWMLSLRKDF